MKHYNNAFRGEVCLRIKMISNLTLGHLFSMLCYLLISTNSYSQERIETIECSDTGNSESFEIHYTRTVPLSPSTPGMNIKISALNGDVEEYEVVFTNLKTELVTNGPDDEFVFVRGNQLFKVDDEASLILEPKYVNNESDERGNCRRVHIPISILNNAKPTVSIANYTVPILVAGNNITRSIDGKTLIDDDNYAGGTWLFSNHDAGFSINNMNGEVTFNHNGFLAHGAKNYDASIIYTDWNNLSATTNITLEVKGDDVPPKLPSQTLSQLFVEGIRKKQGTIKARDVVTGAQLPVRLVGYKKADGSEDPSIFTAKIENGELDWVAPYHMVDDGNSTREFVFLMEPVLAGVNIQPSALTVKIKARTGPQAQDKINEAWAKYEQANSEFLTKIKRPSCYMAYVVSFLDTREIQLNMITNTYEDLGNLAVNIPTKVVPFVDMALDIAKGFSNRRRQRFNTIANNWKATIGPLISSSSTLRQEILAARSNDFQDEFKTLQQATDMANRADAYLTNVQAMNQDVFQAESIINLAGSSNRRDEIREACE